MKTVALVIPSPEYLQSYLEACREFKEHGVLFSSHDPDQFDSWKHSIFWKYERDREGIGLLEGYVPSSTFWLVEDGTFLGVGNIRHQLTSALERFGGHIGYGIRPSAWNQGYGTKLLALLLQEAFTLGIDPALVTCDDDNIGSFRVMEKNGGVYQDTIQNTILGKPRLTRRYWLSTKPNRKN